MRMSTKKTAALSLYLAWVCLSMLGCTLQTTATGSTDGGGGGATGADAHMAMEGGGASPDAGSDGARTDAPTTTSDGGTDDAKTEGGDASGDAVTESGDASGEGGTGQMRPATCLAVLQCIGACADADVACPDECNAAAPSATQTEIVALAKCLTDNVCNDAACADQNCPGQLAGCLEGSKPPSGQPFDAGAPMGSIPASLVGTFSHTGYGATQLFVFNADGTASYSYTSTAEDFGCALTQADTNAGTAVFADSTFTFYATARTFSTSKCGVNTSTPEAAQTIAFDFTYDAAGDELDVVQEQSAGCDYPDLVSRRSYCGYALKRQ